jgi:hypothetical protein
MEDIRENELVMIEKSIQLPILVIGFSVTAEDSLVEIANKRLRTNGAKRIIKVGLGGWFPFLLKFMVDEILDANPASHVIFEISTSSLRATDRSQEDHMGSLMALLEACARRHLPVSFLDLPRADIDNQDDWLFDMHEKLCVKYGLGYKRVALSKGLLRDVVHPTDHGKQVFADALMELIYEKPPISDIMQLCNVPQIYGSLRASDCLREPNTLRSFARSGFSTTLTPITENAQVAFDLPTDITLCGCTMMIGPETGYLTVKCNGFERKLTAYDAFAYYERLNATFFGEHRSDWVVLYQHKERPDIALNKGVPSDAPRMGYVGHFFIKKPKGLQ